MSRVHELVRRLEDSMRESFDKIQEIPEEYLDHPCRHGCVRWRSILPSNEVSHLDEGAEVTVAGLVIRRQHPGSSKAVFVTLEDEFGHTPVVVWPKVFQRYRLVIREPVLKMRGFVSRREGTMNVVVQHVESIQTSYKLPPSKNWG